MVKRLWYVAYIFMTGFAVWELVLGRVVPIAMACYVASNVGVFARYCFLEAKLDTLDRMTAENTRRLDRMRHVVSSRESSGMN